MAQARKRRSPAPMRMPSRTNTTPFTGWRTATYRSRKPVRASTAGSSVNTSGSTGAARPRTTPAPTPATTPHSIIRGRRPGRPRASPAAEAAADHGLAGDGDGVEGEGQKVQQLERDLVGGELGRADAGGDGGGERQRAPEGDGPDEEVAPDAGQAGEARQVGPHATSGGPDGPADHPT